MVYKWNFDMGVPAEKAGKELERLEKKHGCVTPQIVLDESRKKTAPLHKCFEWDDSIAAEKYRLNQAGLVIANLTIILDEHGQSEPVRAFVNVKEKAPTKNGEFINVISALQDGETRAIVLKNALRELEAFQAKYKELTELSSIFSEIAKLKVTA